MLFLHIGIYLKAQRNKNKEKFRKTSEEFYLSFIEGNCSAL